MNALLRTKLREILANYDYNGLSNVTSNVLTLRNGNEIKFGSGRVF